MLGVALLVRSGMKGDGFLLNAGLGIVSDRVDSLLFLFSCDPMYEENRGLPKPLCGVSGVRDRE